ncbi:uncharacterized protein CIMG_04849 [Coccidioides immitis RS]|uniref:Uncharacterized protein n=1 Tax=Coccidioides immitis (strain RS) TaxID=246410 RepID=A0A0E1S3I8_COCIM|nr:uncharacterized protein CIMG_04849 [Coccidioides immitis RS]EAS33825.2 hypothetical protein CIMG_04849 [Coccidioides immitis RS]
MAVEIWSKVRIGAGTCSCLDATPTCRVAQKVPFTRRTTDLMSLRYKDQVYQRVEAIRQHHVIHRYVPQLSLHTKCTTFLPVPVP